VLEYTALTLRYIQIGAEIDHNKSEIDRINNLKALTKDPEVVEFVSMMGRLFTQARSNVIRALYQEHRAYQYWALDDTPFPFVGDQTTAQLDSTNATLQVLELQAKELRGRSKQPFQDLSLTLKKADFADLTANSKEPTYSTWDAFQRTGKLAFQISLDHPEFAGLNTDVLVSAVKLTVPEASTHNGQLRADLIHMGRSLFKRPDGAEFVFLHQPRVTFLWFDMKTGKYFTPIDNNLGGEEDQFAYLSPFAFWTLVIDSQINPDLRLGAVEQVVLEFSGTFYKRLQ